MWTDVEIWSTTTTFKIATLTLHEKWKKTPWWEHIFSVVIVNLLHVWDQQK